MNISIFGLGYVGCVTAACLTRDGHSVWGVDVNPDKVDLLLKGESPIVEPGLSELLAQGCASGRLTATTDADAAVRHTDVSLVSVGTPSNERGEHNLAFVQAVCRQIGGAVSAKGKPHVVVLRSTVPPGTLEDCARRLLEAAGATPVHVAFNPEFLREGAALRDYDEPPYTIVGTTDPVAEQAVRELYASVQAPIIVTPPRVAEMVKTVSNAWHAVKTAFGNEIGRVAQSQGVDGREIMSLFAQDTKLNISPAYLRPGFAYGGSCLPKDLAAISYAADATSTPAPLLHAVAHSNAAHIEWAVKIILESRARSLLVLGLAFKPGTDDLRESPSVSLVKRLLGEGRRVQIFDGAVHKARLLGTNLAYIRNELPHFEALLIDNPAAAIETVDGVVIAHRSVSFLETLSKAPPNVAFFDLVGLYDHAPAGREYHGIAW